MAIKRSLPPVVAAGLVLLSALSWFAVFPQTAARSPNNTVASSGKLMIGAARGQVRLGMGENTVRAHLGPPTQAHQESDMNCQKTELRLVLSSWPPIRQIAVSCSERKTLIYWDGNKQGDTLEILLNYERVEYLGIKRYPLWTVDESLRRSFVGQSPAQVRQRLGEPEKVLQPDFWKQPAQKRDGECWFYSKGRCSLWIEFGNNKRVRTVGAGFIDFA